MNTRTCYLGASLALGLILLGIAGQNANADLYDLNTANQPFADGPPYASVNVSSSPGTGEVQFDVTVLTSPTEKIGGFSFNTDLPGIKGSNFITLPSGWSVSKNANISKFGKFDFDLGSSAAAKRVHQATIVLTGLSSTALSHFEIANSKGALFAVHLFQPTVTGYAASVPTPEPSTISIACLGALGFVGYGLRCRLKKRQISTG